MANSGYLLDDRNKQKKWKDVFILEKGGKM
jgi:hypothetical protein